MVGLLEETQDIKDKDIIIMKRLNEEVKIAEEIQINNNNNKLCDNKNISVKLDSSSNEIIDEITNSSSLSNLEELNCEEIILENVKILLNDLLDLVEDICENGNILKEENNDIIEEIPEEEFILKGILKPRRRFRQQTSGTNKHVDFDLALKYIPFDPQKDFTIEIQFVETLTKKVVSYAALYAQKKAEEEEEEEQQRILEEAQEQQRILEEVKEQQRILEEAKEQQRIIDEQKILEEQRQQEEEQQRILKNQEQQQIVLEEQEQQRTVDEQQQVILEEQEKQRTVDEQQQVILEEQEKQRILDAQRKLEERELQNVQEHPTEVAATTETNSENIVTISK